MSIDDLTAELPSITEGEKAVKNFTDRHEFIRLFVQILNGRAAKNKILFFYGDGGNGKSLLLKFLRQSWCRQIPLLTWQQLSKKSDHEFIEEFQRIPPGEYVPVAATLLDFSQNIGIERSQDPFYGLLMLRRHLENTATALNYHLRFPLYDFACIWYLYKKGKSLEEIKSLFPLTEVAGSITALVDAVSQTTVGAITKAFFDFFAKELGKKFTVYLAKRGLDQEQVEDICRKDLDTELFYDLPRLFAKDLNVAMEDQEGAKRIVLFFDTHEAFWGNQKDLSATLFFQRDEWFRRLLRSLNLESGIIVVVAGREIPRWAEASTVNPGTDIPLEFLETRQVGHLSAADAKLYLTRAGVTDADVSQSLIAYASVEPDQVHPLYLGLGTDVVLQARKQGISLITTDFKDSHDAGNKSRVLIERLLKYVTREIRYAVHALSACRAFNFELYRELAQQLNFSPTRAGFDILVDFSFVWQIDQQVSGWYRIHRLLRRLDDEVGNELTQRAHTILEAHYRERGEIAEAIYHANHQDCQRGLNEWLEVFDPALQSSNYEQCRSLLEVRTELSIQNDFQLGRVSQSEGNYYARLSRYSEAEQEYLEAIKSYENISRDDPRDIKSLLNLGVAFRDLGQLQASLSQYATAVRSYEQAIANQDKVLILAPDDISALTNKAVILQSLGKVQISLSSYQDATQNIEQSIFICDQAIASAPNDTYLLNNKGVSLWSLGEIKVRLYKYEEAMQHYKQAISACDQALACTPDYIPSYNNKGIAYSSLAGLQGEISQEQDALQSHMCAIATYDQALIHAPNDAHIISHKAGTLHSLGQLQAKLQQYDNALKSYGYSIAGYDQALNLTPDDTAALIGKAYALSSMSGLQTAFSMDIKAIESCKLAITCCNQALSFAPDFIEAYVNKGRALWSLGQIYESRSLYSEALRTYKEAVCNCDRALASAPDLTQIHKNKGLLLHVMGFLYVRLDLSKRFEENEKFLESWRLALEEFTQFLEVSPDNEYIYDLKNLLQKFLNNLNIT